MLITATLLTIGLAACGSKTIQDSPPNDIQTDTTADTTIPEVCTHDDQCAPLTSNCAKGICDTVTGDCVLQDRPYGSKCYPDLDCALGICVEGVCQQEQILECEDNNPCTLDYCDLQKGCAHKPQQSLCEDDNPCTTDDYCQQGSCTSGTYVCQQCTSDADCTIYDDGDACNGALACDLESSECRVVDGSKTTCLPSQPCMSAHCDPATGQCVETPKTNGQPCHDEDLCTLEDRCKDGLCQGAALLCSDTQIACASATCQKTSGCVVTTQPNQPCQDGNLCTNDDVCTEDGCVGQAAETCACQDDAECALYDDQDLCTGTVRCIEGSCQVDPTTVVTCPLPGAPCITLYCAPETGLCVPSFPVGPCTDGDLCTENDTCDNGVCKADPLVCDDGDECTTDSCVPSIGCVVEHLPDCAPQKCQDGMHGLCGACGIRTCVGDTWGPCEGEKSCKSGTTDTGACGNCGEHTRTCQPWCEWDEWSECQNEKTCMPLTTDTLGCGECAHQTRTCTDNCEWGDFGECVAFGSCTPGETETQGCGNCGSQSRGCTDGCEWGGWSDCAGQGPCSPGATQGCGECGSQSCGGNCQWGSCQGEGCTPCPTWAATWSAPNGWSQWYTDCNPGCGHGNDCNCNGENWCKPGGSYKNGESAKLWSNGCGQPFVWITCTVKYQ